MNIAQIRELLRGVADPEIPVLSIEDLGVLRDVRREGERVLVEITPTYSGCPAMQVIESEIRSVLAREGLNDVSIETTLSPAWTTECMSDAGRRKLLEYGIAPPRRGGAEPAQQVPCPRCRSTDTERVSPFGSTPCKALYRCNDCLEPFDYFKCL